MSSAGRSERQSRLHASAHMQTGPSACRSASSRARITNPGTDHQQLTPLALVQEREAKEQRRQVREAEQAARERAHADWAQRVQTGLKRGPPTQIPRPVVVNRAATSVTLNLRRDLSSAAGVVGPLLQCSI